MSVQTLYPSKLPNTELAKGLNGGDMVDACLRNAEKAGIKVFIGIGMNDKWWEAPDSIFSWFPEQIAFDNKVCDEVWALYKKKYPKAFHGWYWVYEYANVPAMKEQMDGIISIMNMQLDHINSFKERLPFMWCPFMSSAQGTPEEYGEVWTHILKGLHLSPGDIFAPQDCVGAGWLQLDEVPAWFSALRKAADTKPGLLFWSDVETFDQSDWSSATIDRFVKQMKIEQPYVNGYITFAYSHYNSPASVDPGFHETYLEYVKTGHLETSAPSRPSGLKASVADTAIVLTWEPSADNTGICGYHIYRDGKMIYTNKNAKARRRGRSKSITEFIDKDLKNGTSYIYQIQAYDFANNTSEMSIPLTVR
jgi:hypothetical protein